MYWRLPENKTGYKKRLVRTYGRLRARLNRRLVCNLCYPGLILLCLLGATGAAWGKAPAGRDHPLFPRFPGAVIGHYAQRYDEFILPLDAKVEEYLRVEGWATQIQYRLEGRSTLEVYRYYESLLTKAGFEVLFTHEGRNFEETRQWVAGYYDIYAKQSWTGRSNPSFVGDDFRYLVARLAGGEEDAFLSLYVTTKRRSIVQLDIIEGAPTLGELLIPGLDRDIDYGKEVKKNGFVAIYEIYFASGEAEILESSRQALAEIARFLQENPELTFYVVGHTDNRGTYEFNLDLSRRRAESVARELVETYGIEAERLQAVGVGPVAPVATNETQEGRARNRRVVLVVR
jgi:OOP family OmpA-OmpF porin